MMRLTACESQPLRFDGLPLSLINAAPLKFELYHFAAGKMAAVEVEIRAAALRSRGDRLNLGRIVSSVHRPSFGEI
jgi:hypothetical protein